MADAGVRRMMAFVNMKKKGDMLINCFLPNPDVLIIY